MHRLMIHLSHVMHQRRWIVIAVWIALVAVSAVFAQRNGENLSAGFLGVDGSESQTVQNALDGGVFGAVGNPQIGVVVAPATGATPRTFRLRSAASRRRPRTRTAACSHPRQPSKPSRGR